MAPRPTSLRDLRHASAELSAATALVTMLADSAADESGSRMLRLICDRGQWERAELWLPDDRQELYLFDAWSGRRTMPPASASMPPLSPAGGFADPIRSAWRSGRIRWSQDRRRTLKPVRAGTIVAESRTICALPLRTRGALLGVVAAFSRRPYVHQARIVRPMSRLMRLITLLVQRLRFEDVARAATTRYHAISAELLDVQDQERRRLGRELHDTLAQGLAATSMNLARLEHELAPRSEWQPIVTESRELVDRCVQDLRTVAYHLHGSAVEGGDLAVGLRWYAEGYEKRSGLKIVLHAPNRVGHPDRRVEQALLRVAQEALTNVHRHSGSRVARVTLARRGSIVILRVRDWGRGIRPGAARDIRARFGVGILGMMERIAQIGGTLRVEPWRHGMLVEASVPCEEDA